MKTSKVQSLMKPLKIKKMLESVFGFVPETLIVAEPRFFKNFKEVFNEETFTLYLHWSYVKELLSSTSILSEELRELGGRYQRTLSGIEVMTNVEKYSYQLASGLYSEPVGLYYGKKYFGEEAKKDIIEIVKEIIETYKLRIKDNDILSSETKEKAILKLSKMEIKMGYPDKVEDIYSHLLFDDSLSFYDAYCNVLVQRRIEKFKELSKPVDRSRWVMPGHMVNACYNPSFNDITFPAAILQAPFYSIKQTRSQNLGGIGAVIGHEISHAFDNNGAKCDENGNIKNWWTKEDFKKFDKKTKDMIKEFDGIVLPWGTVNGTFIVSENIADNGGMAVTLQIMKNLKGANYIEYFTNWAKVWCAKAREKYLELLLKVDVHAPAILRANMQPRNFSEWYETFDVKKTDKMYLALNKRVIIW
jgi:putative endopeptidase